MNKDFKTAAYQLKVEKPWGWEIILTPPEAPVTGKVIHVSAGCRLSLQYHEEKTETLTLTGGEAVLILENAQGVLEEIKMEEQKGYPVSSFQKHRIAAISDCDIFEVSTPELGKTVRLEDDYQRHDETEEERKKKRI